VLGQVVLASSPRCEPRRSHRRDRTPAGICTIESTSPSVQVLQRDGHAITAAASSAATMPGRWALPRAGDDDLDPRRAPCGSSMSERFLWSSDARLERYPRTRERLGRGVHDRPVRRPHDLRHERNVLTCSPRSQIMAAARARRGSASVSPSAVTCPTLRPGP